MHLLANYLYQSVDDFLTTSRKRGQSLHLFACIIDSPQPLTARTHATRAPISPFTSPFLHASLETIESYFNKTVSDDESGRYGNVTFIVLDSQTVAE